MFFTDDDSDSSSDDLPVSYLKRELENSLEQKDIFTPRSQIADKFQRLIINFQSSAIVEFLDSLLMLDICKSAYTERGNINLFPIIQIYT